jgi:hypothetical protein
VVVETLVIMLFTIKLLLEARLWLASVTTKDEAERVATCTLPRGETWKKLEPDVEATAKMGKTWEEVEATTYRDAAAGVEELMVKDLAVLSQRKLALPAVVLAPV